MTQQISEPFPLRELFSDRALITKIQEKLPLFFLEAELETRRGKQTGMEVGRVREQILASLLIYQFGRERVNVQLRATEPEADLLLDGRPLSIKTVRASGKTAPPVKVVWTVDWDKVDQFVRNFQPSADLLLAIIRWGSIGGLYGIPRWVQEQVLTELSIERYLRRPRRGTNPRGVDISSEAVTRLIQHPGTQGIPIEWRRFDEPSALMAITDPYSRWIRRWEED
ncbi:MAG: ThaI family type II restriction endonuclease [Armatimonadetes bacterium]|nr:ThaI family type II restriction endonuclease [Armatimonadota bacterium]MDW8122319.1 ThaI family type II restriction endonuclease [Armatimonadota bacterium]